MTPIREQDADHLRRAIGLVREARGRGNAPFGAVLVGEDGKILAEGHNTVNSERDVTGHAETNLVRDAFRSLDAQMLASSALHSIAEPRATRASTGASPDPLTRSPTAGALLLRDNLTGKPKNLSRTLRKERRVWSKDTGTCPE